MTNINRLAFLERHQLNVSPLAFTSGYFLLTNALRWIVMGFCSTKVISQAGADIFQVQTVDSCSLSVTVVFSEYKK